MNVERELDIHSSRQCLIPPVEANRGPSVSPARTTIHSPSTSVRRAGSHVGRCSIGRESDSIGPDQFIGNNPHVTGVRVEAVHLVLQQGWLTEPLKEAISVLNP